jgi:hypothetical protein
MDRPLREEVVPPVLLVEIFFPKDTIAHWGRPDGPGGLARIPRRAESGVISMNAFSERNRRKPSVAGPPAE